MPQTMKKALSRRAIALILGAGTLLALVAPAPALAAGTLAARDVTSTVAGTSVTVTATITNSVNATASLSGICARTSTNRNIDFPLVSANLSPTGTTFTRTAVLPVGSYRYWPCAKIAGIWTDIGAIQTFTTLAAPAPAAATLSATNVTSTVTGTSVAVTAKIRSTLPVRASLAGICGRASNDRNIDFPLVPANLSSVATEIARTAILPVGTYRYWPCAKVGGVWTDIGAIKTFTVAVEKTGAAAATSTSVPMPVGDLPGWKQVFTEDFTTELPRGSFPGPYKGQWLSYTGFTDTSKVGDYDQSIISAQDGYLDLFLHTKNGRPTGAAPVPLVDGKWGGQTYGRFSVRMKADPIAGFGTGFLLWNDSGDWNDGEIDFPESGLDGVVKGYNHCPGDPAKNCLVVNTTARYSNWHTYTIDWTPAKLSFLIDGVEVGSTTTDIPSKPLHWVMQVATTGVAPDPAASGHVLIDWATIYTYAP